MRAIVGEEDRVALHRRDLEARVGERGRAPACEGRDAVLALVPEEAAGPLRLDATLRVTGDGGYTLRLNARP